MRIAALVKQVPRLDTLELGPDGRLVRTGHESEMNPYCRRAVAKGVALAASTGGTCTVLTLGPPAAEDVLREAVACGADGGVLVSDPAFAGSDTLATALALAAALEAEGPFDLVLVGRNSVDADTGQVGPQVAELLELPFASGVKSLELRADATSPVLIARAELEHDDGWAEVELELPAVLSCAERLCDPAKADEDRRRTVDGARIRRLAAADLGPGPWGTEASPTWVQAVKVIDVDRARRVLDGPLDLQVRDAVATLEARHALSRRGAQGTDVLVADGWFRGAPTVAVVGEPDRSDLTRDLLGTAADLARGVRGHVVAVTVEGALALSDVGGWGADEAVLLGGSASPEALAVGLASWCRSARPTIVLGPATMWGREVMSRLAVRLRAGLTGDVIGLELEEGRLIGLKPAFGGRLVAAIASRSDVQMATARPCVLPRRAPRAPRDLPVRRLDQSGRSTVRVLAEGRDDDLSELASAHSVIGVGRGITPDDYRELEPLRAALDASLAATRKVTDVGWLPHARQIGVTGRSISPDLYVAIALSGKLNHMIGVRSAGTILAINPDRDAPVFEHCDVGIVADWQEVVPRLVAEISARRLTPTGTAGATGASAPAASTDGAGPPP